MFLSFISGDGDNFWGSQKIELDKQTWTCVAVPAGDNQVNQTCESGIAFGDIVDKGTNFPVTVSLFGVGMIGVSVMLRMRPQAPAAPAPAQYQANQGPAQPFPAQQQNYPNR